MVKSCWLVVTLMLSGCALIDAATGDGDDDENNVVVIDDDDGPNNVNGTPNASYTPYVCGWRQCPCAYTGCDPIVDCEPVPACRSCRDVSQCFTDDFCGVDGVCSTCSQAQFSFADLYYNADGTEFFCEYDETVFDPVCYLTSCGI